MTQMFFIDSVEFSDEAKTQLSQAGSEGAMKGILAGLGQSPLTEANAQDLIKQVVASEKVKKGLIMRSLRAALTGDLHGPDLMQSWLLLSALGLDRPRLESAIALNN